MPENPVTVLLVEDNEIDIMAIKRAFVKRKVENPLIVAHDGIEALEILRGDGCDPLHQPILILLDLNMPRMGGLQFLDALRKDEKLRRCIVFVLTTSEDDRDKAAAYDRFIAGYVSKIDAGSEFSNLLHLIDQMRLTIHFPPRDEET